MTQADPALITLIGSRICHDLISPVGAITNGLELLEMAGTPKGPELSLIGDSVEHASARIRFFRIAFGAAGTELLSASEVTPLLADLEKNTRVSIQWEASKPAARRDVRLAFLGLLCIESALPFGGRVVVHTENGTWSLTATADRMRIDPALWRRLTEPSGTAGITPASVQFALLPLVAADEGRTLTVTADETAIEIRF